jgi:tripartite ATP-independent transporter DctM subunit
MDVLIIVVILIALIACGLPVAAIITLVALILNGIYAPVDLLGSLGVTAWNQSQAYLLVSIPLFILFGDILFRSGIANDMYAAIAPWLNRVPGKLMQTNIATAALFAATSGSSVATAATIGSVAIPEARKRGYNERLFLGSIAAGGTLGILIPPSINMIVYGAITNTSIPQLYLAGIVPGVLLTGAFMATTAAAVLLRPDWDGEDIQTSWRKRVASLPDLMPPILIFLTVVGSIYVGIATPTEAAALGVLASLILAGARRKLSWAVLNGSLLATMRTTSMLVLILIAANFLNFILGILGFTRTLESFISSLDVGPYWVIFGIVILYLILGCFLDGLSMTVLTVPVLAPVVERLGFDLVWFGILVVLVTEAGLLTPPVGMNCYVVQSVRGSGSIHDVFIGVTPFLLAILALIATIIAIPAIATWLPRAVS